jgi:hypothetical protein
LSILCGIAGLLLARLGTGKILKGISDGFPRMDEIAMDGRVLEFTLFISLFTGLLFGLAPALQDSRTNLSESLKEGGRGSTGSHHRIQGSFVVAEVTLAFVLLIGAGLMLRTFERLFPAAAGSPEPRPRRGTGGG